MLQLLVERRIFWICFDIGLKRVSGTFYCNVSVTFEHVVDRVDEESDNLFTTESVRLHIQESSHVT